MGESKYAYLLHEKGLFRVNVSDFDQTCKHELKLECVFYDQSNFIFTDMALFSHHHNLYMIGGDSAETGRYPDGGSFYTFDPSRFNEFPVNDPECLDEPAIFNDFQPVKWPRVVRAKHMIYFLPDSVGNFHFQSFDPAGNRFYTLPPPPFVVDRRTRFYSVSGIFVLRGYIYLFTPESCGSCFRAFSFNTRLLRWREEESMVLQFKEKDIPLPHDHRGDIGLSDEFSDNTHVLVALSGRMPTAYRVCLHPRGSLSPKSYRHLHEVYIENDDHGENYNVARLLDLGGGKFCLIDYSPTAALLVCVFKIDFADEHENQISSVNEVYYETSEILSSKKFQDDDIPFVRETWFNDVCLASAPASQSHFPSAPSNEKLSAMEEGFGRQEHEVTASPSNEDQDRDEFYVVEDKIEEEYEQIEDSIGVVGDKRVRSLSSLVSRQCGKKASTKQKESQEHDPVALARSLASHFEMAGLDKTGDNALSRWFIRTQMKAIMYGVAMIDRADAASERRTIQEAEYTAAQAKVKVLELQLEASNKANSAAQARLEALEQEKIKFRETVKAQRKRLKAKAEALASTQDKAIHEWRQSEEFRQAAQSYVQENMDAVDSEDQDRDGQMEKRNKTNSHKREMGGNNANKRCCRSRD